MKIVPCPLVYLQKEPALELQHKSLLSAISADMKQMETLEKKLLDSLQDSQG